ncbi:hypothetical protein VIGAN_06269000, partial [Vigna angularis var. angularis]
QAKKSHSKIITVPYIPKFETNGIETKITEPKTKIAGLYPEGRVLPQTQTPKFKTKIAGLYPKGCPSRNSQRPRLNPGPRGGLEIVFNQQ